MISANCPSQLNTRGNYLIKAHRHTFLFVVHCTKRYEDAARYEPACGVTVLQETRSEQARGEAD